VKAPLRFRFARWLLRVLVGTVFSVRTEGLELLPGTGPYLVACNHLSWLDPFVLIGWLPASPRLHFLGKRSAIYNRALKRWTLRFMGGVIPVDSGDVEHLSAAVAQVLQRGGVVGVFPEGGVGPTEGVVQPLRHGIAHFSVRNQAPVVVAGLAGTKELWRGKEVRLRVGRTVWPDGSAGAEATLAAIETALRDALPPFQQPTPGPRPWPWLTNLLR
jgi:1-acyl-sn-glycerol-3-phosphate acyltransferase